MNHDGGVAGDWRVSSSDVVLVILVAVLAHGFLAVNGGVFWDDSLLVDFLLHGNSAAVWHLAADRGIPTDAFIWSAVALLPHLVFAYKIAVVVLLAISGVLALVCAKICGLTRGESLAVACIAVAYPGCEAWVVLTIFQYLVYYVLFLGALWAALSATRMTQRRANIVRGVAGVLFYASFGLNSLLAWSVGVSVLLFLMEGRGGSGQRGGGSVDRPLVRILKSGYPFALAILYWVIKGIFFPTTGAYVGYNSIHLFSGSIIRSPILFVLHGIIGPLVRSVVRVVSHPILLGLAILAAVFAFRLTVAQRNDPPRHWLPLVTAGIVGIALAVLPYAAVGLAPDWHGWSTRHNILLGLPLAVLFVGLVRLAAARWGIRQRACMAGVAFLVAAFAIESASTDVALLGRWAATQSIARNLPPVARRASVVWIDDRVERPDEEPYRFYEWASLLKHFDGVEGHLGVSLSDASPDFIKNNSRYFTSAYNLGAWDPDGCNTAVRLSPGASWKTNSTANGLYYIRTELTQPKRAVAFVDSLVRVTETQPPSYSGKRCSTAE